jgi:hypothetical protein
MLTIFYFSIPSLLYPKCFAFVKLRNPVEIMYSALLTSNSREAPAWEREELLILAQLFMLPTQTNAHCWTSRLVVSFNLSHYPVAEKIPPNGVAPGQPRFRKHHPIHGYPDPAAKYWYWSGWCGSRRWKAFKLIVVASGSSRSLFLGKAGSATSVIRLGGPYGKILCAKGACHSERICWILHRVTG